jgi:hypothetical protein
MNLKFLNFDKQFVYYDENSSKSTKTGNLNPEF